MEVIQTNYLKANIAKYFDHSRVRFSTVWITRVRTIKNTMSSLQENENTVPEEDTNDASWSMTAEASDSGQFDILEDLPSKNIRLHLTFIKWFGLIFIVAICSVPGFVILGQSSNRDCTILDAVSKPDLNQTGCVYVKQFYLHENIYATVCNRDGYVFLDIRHFINGTATIIGVDLSLSQWLTLKQLTTSIDTAIAEARVYWSKLKKYEA